MKTNFIIAFLVVASITVSCKKTFLEQEAVGSFPEQSLSTPEGIKKALVGAYAPLNGRPGLATGPGQLLFGSIRGGEAHKGSISTDQIQMVEIQRFNVTAGNTSITTFFSHFYDAVFRCNLVLSKLPSVQGISDEERVGIEAEAKFLRGHYYFMLKRLFGNIPRVDENNIDDPRVSNADNNGNYVDIWDDILADFSFAMNNLPEQQKDLGRPNKWAAKAGYGKALLYLGNEKNDNQLYAQAKAQLDDVILNGVNDQGVKYKLLDNYHDNFDSQKENGSETVFAVQHSVNDGSRSPFDAALSPQANGNIDVQYIGSISKSGPTLGRGFGFVCPSQWFVNHFRVDANGLPIFDEDTRNDQPIASDDGLESSQPFTPDGGLIDPRLDWTVGRRGIPFLDYGPMQGKAWLRDQAAGSPYMTKKFFTLKARAGVDDSPGGRPFNSLNISIIRFADVLLMSAELSARLGDLDGARTLVNQVRNRMAVNTTSPDNWVLNADNSPAANYRIGLYPESSTAFANQKNALAAVLMERTLELGLEGHGGYDIIRFGLADGATDNESISNYIRYESRIRGYLSTASYSRIPDALMPIPQTAIDNSFKDGVFTLKQNPNY